MKTAIWWIRRDLRLSDNQALTASLAQATTVVPIWVFDSRLLNSAYVGAKRLAFLQSALEKLDESLRGRGSRLIIRHGDPLQALERVAAESSAEAIVAEADFSPYAQRRDRRVAARLPLQLVDGVTLRQPGSVLKTDGKPYTVYSPFRRRWMEIAPPTRSELLSAPAHIPTPEAIESEPPTQERNLPTAVWFDPGKAEAQQHLQAFLEDDIYHYAEMRNRMDRDKTSHLSPYLRFGMISARQVAVAAFEAVAAAPNKMAKKSAQTWLNELIWREFFIHILYHFPEARQHSFRDKYRTIEWNNDEEQYAAWCQGHTGYPIVDAAMRQLLQTGWLHNRARMIVASFLTKDLLIDWRWGERWFMQHLIDGDPAANNGGWQWVAGTGTDAAPYFRIFNPVLQGKKFDPGGNYVRRWIPELADVPDKHIHAPWEMPVREQEKIGCLIGREYPYPIVDRREARERTLAAYKVATS